MSATAAPQRHRLRRPPRRGAAARDINSVDSPWLFLAPYLVLFVAFVLGPIVYGLCISLHHWDFTLPDKPFVGLDNYTDLFTPARCRSSRSGTR